MTVKATNGCGTTNVRVLNNIASTNCPRVGDAAYALNLIAYPNPVSDKLTVGFNSSNEGAYIVRLMDATGRVVNAETKSAAKGENQMEINVKGFSSGIYVLQ